MVELEHATKSLTAFDPASDGVTITGWLNQLIAESLMVPFGMIVLDVFTHGVLQRPLSEENHPVEAFSFQAPKPAFHVRVQVGTLRWQQDDFGLGILLDKATHRDETAVTVHDQMTGIPEEPIFAVGQIATDLSDPCGIGTWCDAGDVDSTCLQVHDSKDVERDQSVLCPHFDRRKVRGENRLPVGFQECGPCRCLLTVGCRLNAVCLQDVGDGGICDLVIQVLECSLNPIESPRGILSGKTNNGIHNFLSDSWPTGLSFIAGIELLRHQFTMPSQDRLRGEDGGDVPQSLAADGVSLHREQATLVVVEQQSLFCELFEQGFDLCVLEFDDLLLTLVHQAAETGQQGVP